MPHTDVKTAIRDSLDKQTVDFQNSSGMSSSNFLDLLAFYLKSRSAVYERKPFSQKDVVYIGSGVAPLLSEICLSHIDHTIHIESGFGGASRFQVYG